MSSEFFRPALILTRPRPHSSFLNQIVEQSKLLRNLLRISALLAWLALPCVSFAQDVEPRRWTHLPIGLNVVGAAYVYTVGDLFFDPVLLVDDGEIEQHTAVVSYTRTFGLAGRTARLDVLVPAMSARWQGLLDGVFTTVRREGPADPIFRLSINLVGGPALKSKEFQEFRAARTTSTIVGMGLAVTVPLGEYKKDKLLNLGGNRVVVRPEIGVVHTRGRWSYELTGSVFLFGDNDEFWNGNKLEQDPLFAVQAHVIHVFRPGVWLALSAAYGHDGESEVNDERKNDPRDTILSAVSFGFPITQTQGLKIAYIRGRMQEDIGADTDNFAIAWSMRY